MNLALSTDLLLNFTGVLWRPCSGSVAVQFDMKVDELSEEASVWEDSSPLFDCVYRLHQGHVVLQHQVGQDYGGRAAHAHMTVHQNLTYGEKKVTLKDLVCADELHTFYDPICKIWRPRL